MLIQQKNAEIAVESQRRVVEEYLTKVPSANSIDKSDLERLKGRIKSELASKNAVLIAHYYTDPLIQQLAEETGGTVSDSLEMARFGRDHAAQTLVVSGVRFMGETAKMLSSEKTVLMPDLDATCSLDLGCPIDVFSAFCDQHPDRTVVVYANTSAAVKARADWVVTSSCALDIVGALHAQGHKILWGPDKHLGSYIATETGADMLLWRALASFTTNSKPLSSRHCWRSTRVRRCWCTRSRPRRWWPWRMRLVQRRPYCGPPKPWRHPRSLWLPTAACFTNCGRKTRARYSLKRLPRVAVRRAKAAHIALGWR